VNLKGVRRAQLIKHTKTVRYYFPGENLQTLLATQVISKTFRIPNTTESYEILIQYSRLAITTRFTAALLQLLFLTIRYASQNILMRTCETQITDTLD